MDKWPCGVGTVNVQLEMYTWFLGVTVLMTWENGGDL